MPGKSNTEPSDTNPTVITPTPFQMMIRSMALDAGEEDGNFGGDDLNAILSAETEEEMWEADERPPLNFQHLAGCELSVLDFDVKFSRGDSEIQTPFITPDGKKMYLLVKCVRLSGGNGKIFRLPEIGEVFTANTSARFIVAKLWRALTMGLINANTGQTLQCMVQATDLGGGQAVLKLRPIPKRSVSSTTI
jgi:hypothetical protein